MDGNRRWAKKKSKALFEGHKAGERMIEPLIDRAIELGVQNLTFWAFSTENWKRNKREISFLLNLFRYVLHKRVDAFHQKKVRLNIIGNTKDFPKDLQKKMKSWIDKTKNNTKITVNMALSYGGRDEILRAINRHRKNSKSNPPAGGQNPKLNKNNFEKYLDTAGQPDPDLLIRTGGEMRLSGFMLWQLEYTELYFTDTLWPDFSIREFDKAVKDYSKRQRRYGK